VLVRVWQYQVVPGSEAEFERTYGRNGDWSRLFAQCPGYLGTGLFRDVDDPGRYLTVDRFSGPQVWQQFLRAHGAEYEALDARCASLRLSEIELV
jgi:heme-degrading monooxygenase HmoA